MAEHVTKMILAVLQAECPALSCPYRQGDGEHLPGLTKKLEGKIKHRVADGGEVKQLEKKLKEVTGAATRALEAAEKGRKLNPQEVAHLRRVLAKKEKE